MPISESLAIQVARVRAADVQRLIDVLKVQDPTHEIAAAMAKLEIQKAQILAHPDPNIPEVLAKAIIAQG
jgi:hypothetical protein